MNIEPFAQPIAMVFCQHKLNDIHTFHTCCNKLENLTSTFSNNFHWMENLSGFILDIVCMYNV